MKKLAYTPPLFRVFSVGISHVMCSSNEKPGNKTERLLFTDDEVDF